MQNRFGRDFTTGSIPRHLLVFSLPMLTGNLLQTAYNIIDTIWVGKYVGPEAVGASAASFPIIFILIALSSGATIATTILVSHYFGAKEFEDLKKVVDTSYFLGFFISASFTIIGVLFSGKILQIMNTPAEIIDLARSYLIITLSGFCFTYFGFLIPSILRGIGDTVTPLIFLATGVVLNCILDPLFIIGIGPIPKLGLQGAAYASVFSQAVVFICSVVYLNRKNHLTSLKFKTIKFDRYFALQIFKIGLPSIVQQSLISIGNAFITTFVNAFGVNAIAAFGAASRIDSIAFMPAMSLGMASSAITGQNLGAKKPERVYEVFKWGIIMTISITAMISLFALIFPEQLISLFVSDKNVIELGKGYLRIVSFSYVFFAVMFISNGIINGSGHTFVTMVFSLVSLWLIRVPLSATLPKHGFGIKGIWISIVVSFATVMTISIIYFLSGKWKKPVVRHKGNRHA